MKTGYRTALAAVGLVAVLAAQTTAQPVGRGRGSWQDSPRGPAGPRAGATYGRPGGPGRGMIFGAALQRLNLNAEQRDKIRDILAESRSDAQAAREAVADGHKALQDAVVDGSLDAVETAADKLADALAKEAKLRVTTMASLKEVLTEEQTEQLEKMKERVGQFRQRRGDTGPRGRMGQGRRTPPQWQRGGRGGPGASFGGRGRQGFGGPQGPGPQRGRQQGFGGPQGPGPQRGRAGRQGSPWRGRAQDDPRPQGGPGGPGRLPVERLFERADTNDDGLLSQDELEAFRDQMNEQPRFRRR